MNEETDKKILKIEDKTAIQSFANWLALTNDRKEKFEVMASETAFIIRRVK